MKLAPECADGCQFAKDVDMPQYACAAECQYEKHRQAQAIWDEISPPKPRAALETKP